MTETTQGSLNVRLAKWAGWTNIEEWETWSDNAETGWCSWKALRGTSPDGIPEQWLPDYASSLDAGMALVRPLSNVVSVWFELVGDKPVASIQYEKPNEMYPGDVLRDAVSAEGADCAEALARALDAMRSRRRMRSE